MKHKTRIKKMTVARAKMREVAEEAAARGENVRLFEAERKYEGRIIEVVNGIILIMRSGG